MELQHENHAIYLIDENSRRVAEIFFPEIRPGVVNICHTEVAASLSGQGMAGKLTREAAEKLRADGKKAVLTCSYAIRWFAKHPEYSDVLEDPDAEAAKAGMTAGPACGIRR